MAWFARFARVGLGTRPVWLISLEELHVLIPSQVSHYTIVSLAEFLFSFVFYMVTNDDEYKTKEYEHWTKDKIEPQHMHLCARQLNQFGRN